jgi:predicted AlkP superfamily phosphohydrolase/phosphomutase
MESKIGRYYVDINVKGEDYGGSDEETFLEEAYLVTRQRVKAMKYLMKNYDWDFLLTVFTTLDRVQHVFFGYLDEDSPFFNPQKSRVLIEYYKEMDKIIGDVTSSLSEDTMLFIVSDHGFTYLSRLVGMNNLLAQRGFITERSKLQIFTVENLNKFFQRIGIRNIRKKLPRRLRETANTVIPRKINFLDSKCFFLQGYIYINQSGFHNQEALKDFQSQLIDSLYSITDVDTGEPIVEKVYHRTELYHGNQIVNAGQLVVRLKKGYEGRSWVQDTFQPITLVNDKTFKTGTHHSISATKGIFIASGSAIKSGFQAEANIVDVTPTILHVLGVPIPTDMDGHVLQQIFTEQSEFKLRPITFREPPTQRIKEKTRERARKIRASLKSPHRRPVKGVRGI